jgi:hypothetical protein
MSHTLIGADRQTHLRIVAVALAAATAVVATSVTSRIMETDRAEWLQVAKVSTPTLAAVLDATSVR